MFWNQPVRWRRLGLRALLSTGVLLGEAIILFILFMMEVAATGALVQYPTAADVEPGVEHACLFGLWAVPACLVILAVWRKYWAVAGVQLCLLCLLCLLTWSACRS